MSEKKWMQGVKHTGEFKAKAKKAGMSTLAFADKEKHDKKHPKTMHQAQAAANMIRASRKARGRGK